MTTSPEQPTVRITRAPEQPRPPRGANGGAGVPPKLADGIELLGEYEDSGFKEPHYVARRADGQVIQLSRLLHVVAEQADGRRGYDDIAARTSEALGRNVSADNVRFLVDKKLRPLGVLAQPDGSSPPLQKADPLLALKFRAALVPEWLTRALTTVFYPLFFPPVVLAVLAAIVAVDIWFFFVHGAAQSTRELLYNPLLLVMVLGLVVLATALHELGHATALRYGGGRPGVMGAGIYVVWPAFYTDVTDAYRLGRGGRLRTDLGGVYFNGIFVLAVAAAYFLTGFEPLLVLIPIQHFQVLQQMLPFLRLDGYYVLSDLTGVPDLFARIRPTLKSAVPGVEPERKVHELKPWVRAVTTGWVIALIPILIGVFGLMIFNAPRMFATAWDSFFVQKERIGDGGLQALTGSLQLVALVLPLAGMTYSFGRVGKRIVGGAWSWTAGAPVRRAFVVLATAAVALTGAYVLLPNGDYRPIQPDERGTIQGGLRQFAHVGSGRPSLTEERERQLGGAPTERSQRDGTPAGGGDEQRDQPATTREQETTPTGGRTTTAQQETTQTQPSGGTAPTETTQPETTQTPTTETTTP